MNLPNTKSRSSVLVRHIKGEEWLCSTPRRCFLTSTSKDGSAPSAMSFLLLALGVSACDNVRYILEDNKIKINSMKSTISGEWQKNPRCFKEIKVKFDVDSPDASKEEIAHVADIVLDSICPISNTIKMKPKITMKGVLANID